MACHERRRLYRQSLPSNVRFCRYLLGFGVAEMLNLSAMATRVYLQSRDLSVQRSLAEQLRAKGYLLAGSDEPADVIVLEGGLAAAAWCDAWRRRGDTTPILLLGLSPAQARAAGGDDGLATPFHLSDLVLCLDRLQAKGAITVGRFRLDAKARQMVDGDGRSLRFTEKEAAILAYLARAGDSAVGRDELLGEVWGYANGATTHTVETHIYRLRRKLSENGGDGLLRTEEGGYRLERAAERNAD